MLDSPLNRSAYCLAVATINAPHMVLWQEQGNDQTPFKKLLQKQTLWLLGELKSKANLERHFTEFEEWRKEQIFDDSIGGRIQDMTCTALHLSLEQLLDTDCDDIDLLEGYIGALMDELDDLDQDTQPMRQYLIDIQTEFSDFGVFSNIPLPKQFRRWLSEFDASLFGLTL